MTRPFWLLSTSRLFLVALFFYLVGSHSFALEMDIDDKIVARILGVSESRRTVLINRGEEHGLKVGHHARFSTPQDGYFARAVVVRISPSRSVWSIYRVPTSGILRENLVTTVKIATPVVLTDDETRALGIMASTYQRRIDDEIPRQQEARPRGEPPQRSLTDHLVVDEEQRRSTIHRGRDFSNLHSSPIFRRDAEIDWSGLDHERELMMRGERGRREGIDYSSLDSRN